MTEAPSDEDTNVSLTHLQASRYPLMRRVDQQFTLENKFSDYQKEIYRVSKMNKSALSSLGHQERRLREMQALLRSSSSIQNKNVTQCHLKRPEAKLPPIPYYKLRNTVQNDITTGISHLERPHINVEEHWTASRTAVEDDSDRLTAKEKSGPQTSIRETIIDNTIHTTSAPGAPANFLATEIRHNSFAVQWDTTTHDAAVEPNPKGLAVFDYELRYTCSSEGKEIQILHRCSRWCLKDPVPTGRFVVQNLQPNTDYREIAIRCLNHVGWSEFSYPIKCLTTASKDEDFENRHSKFIYRIGYIEQSIKNLEATKQQLPVQQLLLAQKMSQTETRMFELNEEIERVVQHEGNKQLSSHLLHGASQVFTKAALKRQLEQEVATCKENIAGWRADVIDMDKEISDLTAELRKQESQLHERKAALLKFDRQHVIVSSMRQVVSKQPHDIKQYYIVKWRSRVVARLNMRKTLNYLTRSCKQRIYARAWRQLSSLVSSRRELIGNGNDEEHDGIGGVLLDAAEKCMQEDLADASHLIKQLDHIQENQDGLVATIENCPTHVLCKEDNTSLTKGDFLFNAGHYDSALNSYRLVLSKMQSRDYFSALASTDAVGAYAEVNGKIGHAHIKLGSFDLAIVHFGRQLSLAEEEDLDNQRIGALVGLGMCYHEKYDHQYAESFFTRALKLCLSRGDKAREVNVYKHLQKCCECLNRPADAAAYGKKVQKSDETSWNRECGGTVVSRKGVENAMQDLDSMRSRLIHVIGSKAKVVKLEVASARLVRSLRAKSNKEQQLQEATEHLSTSKQFAEEMQDLIEQIEYEKEQAEAAKHTKKNRLVSGLIQGHKQEIKAAELLFRLQEELRIVKGKLEESLIEISQTEMLIHNTKDDIKGLSEQIIVENCPLMQQVLKGRKYRCISLNASNIACDDVTGTGKGGVAYVALSEGESCYVHNLQTGKLENVFVGDEDGATATITSLFFYAHRVYTGTMDSVLIGWDLSTSKKLFVAKGHESSVTCIHADNSKVISGSADKSIIVWDTDGKMLRRVLGHSRGIHCVQCGPRWCVSASYRTVFVWDILTEKEAETITGFNCRCRLVSEGNVTALQYGELEVITGDSLGAISVWWIESGELLKIFDAHNSPVASLQVDSTKSISCGLDMIVVVSDIMRGEVLHTLRGHTAPVLDVAFDRKQIMSLSSDGELRYWSWESPSNHSRSDIKAERITDENESDLRGDFGSKKENLNIEEDGREVSDSRSSKNKGTLMNRLVKFHFRRNA